MMAVQCNSSPRSSSPRSASPRSTLLAIRQRPGLGLETYEPRAVLQRDLLVLLVAQYQRDFAGAHVANLLAYPHSQPSGENQHHLLALVVMRLRAGSRGLGVVADLQ